jgi:hypothetical protein
VTSSQGNTAITLTRRARWPGGEGGCLAQDAADFLAVKLTTWRAWVTRGRVLKPDAYVGNTPVWRAQTVREWAARPPRKPQLGQD